MPQLKEILNSGELSFFRYLILVWHDLIAGDHDTIGQPRGAMLEWSATAQCGAP